MNGSLLYQLQLCASDGMMPDCGTILKYRVDYCNIEMQMLLGGTATLLSYFRKYSHLLALVVIILM